MNRYALLITMLILVMVSACVETVTFTPDSHNDPNAAIYVVPSPFEYGFNSLRGVRDDATLQAAWTQRTGIADSIRLEITNDGTSWVPAAMFPFSKTSFDYVHQDTVTKHTAYRITNEFYGEFGKRESEPVVIAMPPTRLDPETQPYGRLGFGLNTLGNFGRPYNFYIYSNEEISSLYQRTYRLFGRIDGEWELIGTQTYRSGFSPPAYKVDVGFAEQLYQHWPHVVRAEVTYSIVHQGTTYPIETHPITGGEVIVPWLVPIGTTYENRRYTIEWINYFNRIGFASSIPAIRVEWSADFGETWIHAAMLPRHNTIYHFTGDPDLMFRVTLIRDGEPHPSPLIFSL